MKRRKHKHPCERCSMRDRSCQYNACGLWREWFSKEWNDIRKIYRNIKENKK